MSSAVSWWVRCAVSPDAPPRARRGRRRPGKRCHGAGRPGTGRQKSHRFHRSIVAMCNPAEGRDASAAPALCAVLLGVGPETDAPHAITTIRLAASTPTQVPPGQPGPEGGPMEDLVPVPLGRLYVWPSGIGLLWVTRPTAPRRWYVCGRRCSTSPRRRTTSTRCRDRRRGTTGATSRGSPIPVRPSRSRARRPSRGKHGVRDDAPGRPGSAHPAVPGRLPVRGRGGRPVPGPS